MIQNPKTSNYITNTNDSLSFANFRAIYTTIRTVSSSIDKILQKWDTKTKEKIKEALLLFAEPNPHSVGVRGQPLFLGHRDGMFGDAL